MEKELLEKGLENLNIKYTEKNLEDFILYKNLLLEWNEKVNLTAITNPSEIITKHFLDSLTVFPYLKENSKVIDIGTGAGFPGLPLKIMDNSIKLTLLDSLNKRLNFLNEVIKNIDLKNVETVHMRSEDGGKNKLYREKYDLALSRAVATLPILCEYCLPYVKVGGKFIALKGKAVIEEINLSNNAISVLGGKILENKKVHLPNSDIDHYLVVIEKIKPTPKMYPRIQKKINEEIL